MSHGKVKKLVLLLTVMYACFAVLDDSPCFEPDPASANEYGFCIVPEVADDATPWLSLNLDHHRSGRTAVKQLTEIPVLRNFIATNPSYSSFIPPLHWHSPVRPDVRLLTGICRI